MELPAARVPDDRGQTRIPPLAVMDQLTGPLPALSESLAPNRPTVIWAPGWSETAEPSRDTDSVAVTGGGVVVTGAAGVVVVGAAAGADGALLLGVAAADDRW